jgi:large subunit ribosomal protein L30
LATTTLQITQLRSANGTNQKQRATLHSLGLGRIGASVERRDGPAVQGMLRAVSHLVEVRSGDKGAQASDG